MIASDRRLVQGLSLAFFLSGFAALLYQVIWQRMLGLFTGSDVRSVTLVTGAFLGGLGVGSLIGAAWADRLSGRRAVRWFGWCNLIIALFAIGSRFLLYDLLFGQWIKLSESPALLMIIVFASLLLPTTVMGLSLPLLSKAVSRNMQMAARRIGRLYGVNTLGAALGALVTGWYLAGTLGYDRTLYLGSALSVIVGAIALWIAQRFTPPDQLEPAPIDQSPPPRRLSRPIVLWCGFVFVAGFMAVSLELIWFRVLDVTLKSNAYTFAYLLFFYLACDGWGSLMGARVLPRITQPRQVFWWVQGIVALYALLALLVTWWLAGHFAPLQEYVTQFEGLDAIRHLGLASMLVYIGLPVLLLSIPVALAGMNFPLAQQAVQTDYQAVGRRVGLIKTANIAGNTLGSILTGLLLLDRWGTVGTTRLIGVVGLVFAVSLSVEGWRAARGVKRWAGGLLAVGLVIVIGVFPAPATFWSALHGSQPPEDFVVAEDSSGVAALRRAPLLPAIVFANGQSQATIPYLQQHVLLGATPALVHPAPERTLLIGVGSGGTPFAAGVNPATKHLRAIEIIGSELEALQQYRSGWSAPQLDALLDDPRYEFIIGDGRQYLALTDERYDIIEADAIRPQWSHSGLLYSREFFAAARAALNQCGIMAQWAATARVKRTFQSVFPYGVDVGNFILLGSACPIVYDSQSVLERWQTLQAADRLKLDPALAAELREWWRTASVTTWVPGDSLDLDDINTDLRPKDEYFLNQAP